jgi:hypothetical protein
MALYLGGGVKCCGSVGGEEKGSGAPGPRVGGARDERRREEQGETFADSEELREACNGATAGSRSATARARGRGAGMHGRGKRGEAEHNFDFIGLTGRGNDGWVERPSMATAGAGSFDGN